jgi:hypothetical protein
LPSLRETVKSARRKDDLMESKVLVTRRVHDGLDRLIRSDIPGIEDPSRAVWYLEEHNLYAASDWILDNWETYKMGLQCGFDIKT